MLPDSSSLLYAVQQQALGSIQWTIIASNLRETSYAVSSLSKGVRYAFRVLTATSKVLSKPSPSTDLVQLMDRGVWHSAVLLRRFGFSFTVFLSLMEINV